MATNTYTPLANITLGSSPTTVTFSNIPNTYRDLILVINGRVGANSNMVFFYNADSSNGTAVWMTGNGSTASSSTIGFMFAGTWNANQDSNAIVQIMDYSATDKHKTSLVRSNQPSDQGAWAIANRWASNTAVNSITIDPTGSNTITSGTTLALYGVIA